MSAFDFLGQLLLLVLISPGHSGKAFIRDFAGNIVLIDALKEAVQFFITGKECFQLFLFQLAVGFVRLLGVPDNSLQKVVLIEAGKLKLPDLYILKTEYKLLAEQKDQLQRQYAEAKRQMQEYGIIKQNVDGILRTTPGKEQMQER